jgi:NADH dehydrogenase (ubiquinone) Fe-S protein 1
VESATALRDLLHSYDSESLFTQSPFTSTSGGTGLRSNYLLNSTIAGIEDADLVLLVGTNPRYEAPLLNARLRKSHIHNDLDVAIVGPAVDLTYEYEHLGESPSVLNDLAAGKIEFSKDMKKAENVMIIIGSEAFGRKDADGVFASVQKIAKATGAQVNVLHNSAGQVGALDLGYKAGVSADTSASFLYLLGADAVPASVSDDAFVVYQGSHGDAGAAVADVILPGAAYTEKDATYVNTEGRAQSTRRAVTPPGLGRDDWKIVRALSEFAGRTLPYDTLSEVRARMAELCPSLTRYDNVEKANFVAVAASIAAQGGATVGTAPIQVTQTELRDYYQTDAITRASATMAKCTKSATNPISDRA